MKRIAIAAALLATFSLPAFAEDVVMPKDDTAQATKVEPTTARPDENATKQSVDDESMYGGCMRRHTTKLNMM